MVGDGPEFVAVTERGEEFHHVAVAHLAKDFGLALCGLLVAKPHLQHQDKSAQQLLLEKPAFFAAIGRHRHCPENTSPLAPDPSEASKTKALGKARCGMGAGGFAELVVEEDGWGRKTRRQQCGGWRASGEVVWQGWGWKMWWKCHAGMMSSTAHQEWRNGRTEVEEDVVEASR